jgi:hypothetical protein
LRTKVTRGTGPGDGNGEAHSSASSEARSESATVGLTGRVYTEFVPPGGRRAASP